MFEMKNILITGASSEIGIALIKKIYARYDTVWAHYNHSNQELEGLLVQLEGKIKLVSADFSNIESVREMMRIIIGSDDKPDHIVHLASAETRNKPFVRWNIEEYERQISVMLYSIIEILGFAIPYMAEKKEGKVLFMSSSMVEGVSPKYQSPYIVSKYALYGLMRNLAAEYSGYGIQVNSISPDMIDTKFNGNIVRKIKEVNAERNPLGRNLIVEDIVPMLCFMLSDGADAISGANIPITAGIELT